MAAESTVQPIPIAAESTVQARLRVKSQNPTLIVPAEATPKHRYFLSNLDQSVVLIVQTVYCYNERIEMSHEDPAQIIKEALRKVLVEYYPLAGRLRISPEGRLNVDCNAQGALFVEAEADCSLEDIGELSKPDPVMLGNLVYKITARTNIFEIPLLLAQVTKFQCGGFVLGLSVNQCMFDGLGAMEFVNSWSETARGMPLSVPPFVIRTMLKARSPPRIDYPHNEFCKMIKVSSPTDSPTDKDMYCFSSCFGPERLKKLKKQAMGDGKLKRCTTFEALSAHIWRCRSKALEMAPFQKTKLLFQVDGRPRFEPPLPKGYFGNGSAFAHCLCTAEDLSEKPLSFAVGLVQKAVAMMTDKYMRSAIDYLEINRERPWVTATLLITHTWSRLPFHTSDFGWGEAIHTGPATLPAMAMAMFMLHGKERKSINVFLCLPSRAMHRFQQYIHS